MIYKDFMKQLNIKQFFYFFSFMKKKRQPSNSYYSISFAPQDKKKPLTQL